MGKPLWDAKRHGEYVRQRDEAIERRIDQLEGTSVARDIDSTWGAMPADERQVLEYLVLSDARSCIGHCADPLLSRLVARGMMSWPPGVRPVLTDDLVTAFQVAPALWSALHARRDALFPTDGDKARALDEASRLLGERLTPIRSSDGPDPGAVPA